MTPRFFGLNHRLWVGGVTILLFAESVFADPLRALSPVELFTRCYAHLTQLRLAPNHPLRAAVAAGTMDPIDACMKVFGEAALVPTGASEGTIANSTTVGRVNESLAVLRNFNSLHVNFSGNSDLIASTPDASYKPSARTVVDETEFSLHFTRALFTPGEKASQIVAGTTPMEALRSNGRYAGGPIPLGVQIGDFLGVKKMPADKLAATIVTPSGTTAFNAHQGGGALGAQSFIMMNFGLGYRKPDGGLAMPRRWAKAVYRDLLCRAVPVIRLTDASNYLQTKVSAATPPFRTSNACVQCHASMDPMAATARNFFFSLDGADVSAGGNGGSFMLKIPPTLAAETAVVDYDSSYSARPPNGTLRFRSYDGTLIEQPVSSLAELGTQISQTNDFYACLASRYFHYFTGINASLQDIGDTSLPALSSSDLYYRNLVLGFGSRLKASQDLPSLIRDILSSAPYRSQSFRSGN